MTRISCESARNDFGITCEHEQMRNGELRFRLKSAVDGTAYIRTQATPSGDWQKSHFHKTLQETYIVQSGWIGYAELTAGVPRYRIFREGQLFTTSCGVIHTVYLPAEAVIHTVKHGHGDGDDRHDDYRTWRFDVEVSKVSEADLLRHAAEAPQKSALEPASRVSSPDEAYKHFDGLIWQVPAWSTAVFAIVVAGMTQFNPNEDFTKLVGLDADHLMVGVCGLFGMFVLALSHALYRFRWHQAQTPSAGAYRLLSPQISLQLLVNVQSFVFVLLTMRAIWPQDNRAVSILVGMYLAIMLYQEWRVWSKGGQPS